MARRNGWFVFEMEEGGFFNPAQLKQFKVVIFNNATGRVLNDAQQEALGRYVEAGGPYWAFTAPGMIPTTGPGTRRTCWAPAFRIIRSTRSSRIPGGT